MHNYSKHSKQDDDLICNEQNGVAEKSGGESLGESSFGGFQNRWTYEKYKQF